MSLQPDITAALFDPELGAQRFSILRRTGVWKMGRVVEETDTIHAVGNIQPATKDDLEQLPEGDRKKGIIVIRTTTPIYETGGGEAEAPQTPQKEHTTDEIVWRGNAYKVLSATLWGDFGWYEAYATRE